MNQEQIMAIWLAIASKEQELEMYKSEEILRKKLNMKPLTSVISEIQGRIDSLKEGLPE